MNTLSPAVAAALAPEGVTPLDADFDLSLDELNEDRAGRFERWYGNESDYYGVSRGEL